MDGLRINPGTIGTAAMQNIAPEFVERIEIVKGPRSTLYGSDAIGGVINMITRGRRGRRQRARRLRQITTRARPASRRLRRRKPGEAIVRGAWIDSDGFPTRTGDDTDRGYENTSFTACSARRRRARSSWACAAGTPRALPSTRISSWRPVDQDFENMTAGRDARISAPTEAWCRA